VHATQFAAVVYFIL